MKFYQRARGNTSRFERLTKKKKLYTFATESGKIQVKKMEKLFLFT